MEVRERVSRFGVPLSRGKMLPFDLSWVEILAAAVAVVCLVAALTRYLTTLRPEQARLRQLEQQLANQERGIVQGTGGAPSASSPSDIAKEALDSLEQFKTGRLRPLRSGQIDLLKGLNELAKKSKVHLTSGIDTTLKTASETEEEAAGQNKSPKKRKPEEILNAFPSVGLRFSVAGEYANLRSFISELEASKQFLIINTVSISHQEARTTGRSGRGQMPGGLMLSIEMVAYFRPA